MADVDFFFDYSCPWTYMAFSRLCETAARTGSRIQWYPIKVDRVRRAIDPGCPETRCDPEPRKAAYAEKDLQDWADFCSLQIEKPADWPPDTEIALSCGVLAAGSDLMSKYSESVFRGYFADGRDISQLEVVADIARSVGLERVVGRISAPEPARQVRENEAELIQLGGFGSPTMFVGDAMFFGNDRMPLVEFALGQASGRTFVTPGQHS